MTHSNLLQGRPSAVRPAELLRGLLAGLLFMALSALPSPAQRQSADAVFVHGNILTGSHLKVGDSDATPARVHALAVRDGRIVAAGEDAAVLALRDDHTTVVDLHGAFTMPGFNDAHTHMAQAGEQRLYVDLVGAQSLAEMQDRIRRYVATTMPEQWILGGGWDHTLWPGRTLPTRADLDAVTAGHPALLIRVDGHIGVANTAALQRADLMRAVSDPAGGKIDRNAAGQPTGIVREAPALAMVEAYIPKPDKETRQRALRLSVEDALAHGVTSVQDFSDWEDWLVLETWEREGQLPLRFAEWIAFDTPLPTLTQRRLSHPANDPLLHLTQLKAFMDGSLGSRTAALCAPYSDDPQNAGLPRYEQAKLNQMAAERAQAGFQLGFHAIGDRANDVALDAFEAAEKVWAPSARSSECEDQAAQGHELCTAKGQPRFRIEHAQVVSPGAFERFAQLGVIASMQPSHLLTDMAWAGQRLGPERSARAYAWRSFLQHGVPLAFGTDYPVESISPFRGLYAAVTRQNEAGTQTFHPEERLTLNEALYAYTQASAYAEFRETEKGRLVPGFLADFVVLDRDITKVSPKDLLNTRVLRTVVNGATRYQAPVKAGGASASRGMAQP